MVEHGRQQIYDKERVHWNTAWIKSHGEHFEVVINPDEALLFRQTKGASPQLTDCLRSEHVFSEAKRGEIAAEDALKKVFGTTDELAVARKLVLEGELQISAEHRAQLRERKRNKILTRIQAYAIDPKTGLPHPRQRIELAMEEAKIKIDEREDAEEQVKDIVKKLQPIIPIRLEMATLQVHVPNPYGQKLYGDIEKAGTLRKTEWLSDGSLLAWVEIPAGLQTELLEELGSKSHGAIDVKKIDEKPL